MAYVNPRPNVRTGSTTWTPKVDSIKAPAGRAKKAAPGRRPFSHFSRRDPRLPLNITIRYRGGSEAWIYVEGRGAAQAFPGYLSLYDVLMTINARASHLEES